MLEETLIFRKGSFQPKFCTFRKTTKAFVKTPEFQYNVALNPSMLMG